MTPHLPPARSLVARTTTPPTSRRPLGCTTPQCRAIPRRCTPPSSRPTPLPIALILGALCLCAAATAVPAGAEASEEPHGSIELSLEQALKLGLARNRGLETARIDSAIAAQQHRGATALRWPQLGLEATARRQSDVPRVPVGDFFPEIPGFDPGAIEIRMGDEETYDARLRLRETLFGGGRISNTIATRAALAERADLQLEAESTALIEQIVRTYFGLIKARQAAAIADAALAAAEARSTDLANLLDAGQTTRDELLALEAHVGRSRIALLEARHRVSLAGLELLRILGLPLDRKIRPTAPPDALSHRIGAAGLAARLTAEPAERDELRAARMAVRAARSHVALERAERIPSLGAQAEGAYGRPGLDPFANEWEFYWTAALAMHWTAWDGGQRDARIEAAQLELRRAEQRRADLEGRLQLAAAAARLGLREAHERVEVAETLVTASEERRRIVEDRFAQGLATASNLVVAQQEETQARLARATAIADLQIAITACDRALGWIDPRAGEAIGEMP
ncbi:MAG: hypothetical protein GF330_08285 [Candidatus Eisenbacteria bacterium]|nr:hypothetical protein [Candidatus Eisenbacteria bacterium]